MTPATHGFVEQGFGRNDSRDGPARSASCASIMRPVRHISMAFDLPTSRVSLCVPPAPGRMPSLISG